MSGSGEIHASFSPDQWASVAPPTGPLDPGHLHTRVIKGTNKGGSLSFFGVELPDWVELLRLFVLVLPLGVELSLRACLSPLGGRVEENDSSSSVCCCRVLLKRSRVFLTDSLSPTGRAGDPRRGPVALVRREKISDDDRVCAAAKARTHLAATRPKRAASTGTTHREVATPFSFLELFGDCVCV